MAKKERKCDCCGKPLPKGQNLKRCKTHDCAHRYGRCCVGDESSCTWRAVLAEALRRCKVGVIEADATVTGGLHVVLAGKPRITQSGGDVWTYGSSAPVITRAKP